MEEFQRYFGSIKLYEHGDELFQGNSRSNNSNNENNDNELWQEEPLNGNGRYENEMTRILIADGFVSVLLTCLLEHKNYASVSYDQSAVSCTLSMPADLRVSISRRGHYEVWAPGEVNLKVIKGQLLYDDDDETTVYGRRVV